MNGPRECEDMQLLLIQVRVFGVGVLGLTTSRKSLMRVEGDSRMFKDLRGLGFNLGSFL